jgi:hypothetical protein
MEWTNDMERKQNLADSICELLHTAGYDRVDSVTYCIENREELYRVYMDCGAVYRINVSADSPLTAAADVINFMKFR